MPLLDLKQNEKNFAVNESEIIKRLEESILILNNKSADLSLANLLNSKYSSSNKYIFEDKIYQGVIEDHIKTNSLFYKLCLMNVSQRLVKDIEMIQYYKDYLKIYNEKKDYKKAIEEKKKENSIQYLKIQQMEQLFGELMNENIENLKKNANKTEELNFEDEKKEKRKSSHEYS